MNETTPSIREGFFIGVFTGSAESKTSMYIGPFNSQDERIKFIMASSEKLNQRAIDSGRVWFQECSSVPERFAALDPSSLPGYIEFKRLGLDDEPPDSSFSGNFDYYGE